MRLVTFRHSDSTRVGVLDGTERVDLAAAVPALPTDMVGLLAGGAEALAAARAARGPRLALAEVQLLAPVLRPPKILAIGLNYADHG